jgi:hypothetical protein
VEYALAYAFQDAPALNLRLTSGIVHGRFFGYSKPLTPGGARILFRYGAAVEQGNQQTNLPGGSSRYGAVKLYGGLTGTTRRSETAISYGLSAGGPVVSLALEHPERVSHVIILGTGSLLPPLGGEGELLAGRG